MDRLSHLLDRLPYIFLVFAGGLCVATFFTSETLAAAAMEPCVKSLIDAGI